MQAFEFQSVKKQEQSNFKYYLKWEKDILLSCYFILIILTKNLWK